MKDIHDVIRHAKFRDDRLRGSGVVAGQISAFPIDFAGRPYNTLALPCERVIVMEVISREFRVALPWELLYADDLAVTAENEEELIKRLNEWNDNVESKDMRVSMKKQRYDKWRTSEGEAEGCKMAMWGLQ